MQYSFPSGRLRFYTLRFRGEHELRAFRAMRHDLGNEEFDNQRCMKDPSTAYCTRKNSNQATDTVVDTRPTPSAFLTRNLLRQAPSLSLGPPPRPPFLHQGLRSRPPRAQDTPYPPRPTSRQRRQSRSRWSVPVRRRCARSSARGYFVCFRR